MFIIFFSDVPALTTDDPKRAMVWLRRAVRIGIRVRVERTDA